MFVGGDMGYRESVFGGVNSRCKGWEERKSVVYFRI